MCVVPAVNRSGGSAAPWLAEAEVQQGIPWQSQPEPAQPGRRMHGSGEGALQHEKPFDGLSGTPCGQD
jgi:hypothetical protein